MSDIMAACANGQHHACPAVEQRTSHGDAADVRCGCECHAQAAGRGPLVASGVDVALTAGTAPPEPTMVLTVGGPPCELCGESDWHSHALVRAEVLDEAVALLRGLEP
jgi:hypothetical protein